MSARALSTAVGLAVLVGAAGAAAHPLGNFSINHYAALEIAPPVVYVRYIIDLAEIPTFQEIQETGVVADVGHPSAARYATDKAEALGRGLTLEVDGRRLALEQRAQEIVFPPGVGDLPTLKLGVLFRAQLPADAAGRELTLRYRDENFPGRAGWKEIIAVVRPGVTLVRSTVPSRDRSGGLASYPTDLLGSPPQDLEAQIVVLPAASAVAGFPSSERAPPIFGGGAGARRPTRDRFAELVGTPDASLGVSTPPGTSSPSACTRGSGSPPGSRSRCWASSSSFAATAEESRAMPTITTAVTGTGTGTIPPIATITTLRIITTTRVNPSRFARCSRSASAAASSPARPRSSCS